MADYDAIIVGAGPNGLAAAIILAQAGLKVLVLEASNEVGGGMRTAELTLPGFWHDVCSTVHTLGVASPFFRSLPLADYGLEWIYPPVALAHPLDDGQAALVGRTTLDTAATLGKDGKAYRRLFDFLVRDWEKILEDMLGPLPLPPRHPLADIRFGLAALLPARTLAQAWFRTSLGRAFFGGLAAHAILPVEKPATAAFGLMLGMLAQAVGWPVARGGSRQVGAALAAHLQSLGGEIETGCEVKSLDELPSTRAILMDVTPRQLLRIAGERLPAGYHRQLARYRYGPGVCKVDWALSGPIPWKAAGCSQAGSIHLGGTLEEISASEEAVWRNDHPERPYTIVVQASLFDPSRAPQGQQTAWAYCHVPNGSTLDMTARIEAQVERFAPGFRDLILARSTKNAAAMEAYNPNYVGGDINGGVQDLSQLFTRPTPRVVVPYATPVKGLYLCSSSTPPGGGVHGMCGVHAAYAALSFLSK